MKYFYFPQNISKYRSSIRLIGWTEGINRAVCLVNDTHFLHTSTPNWDVGNFQLLMVNSQYQPSLPKVRKQKNNATHLLIK